MTSTSRLMVYPFKPVKSFFEVAIGAEQIELRPEWQRVFAPSDRAVEPRKAA